ncbi:MAG: hypothetical protein K2Y14_03340 [Burkholderiales bacterium]|nr:hypothetical protein [Burkholderiales bacterium]
MPQEVINNYVFNNSIKYLFDDDPYSAIKPYLTNITEHVSIPFKVVLCSNNKVRQVDFPNFFTYSYVANKLHTLDDPLLYKMNRMEIDFDKKKFKAKSYSNDLREDLKDLMFKYEVLSFFDISNFYNSIYTHVFEKISSTKALKVDENIRLLNNNKTKGILLGNYLSISCASHILEFLSNAVQQSLSVKKIKSEISYFSDQLYIKHKVKDIEIIKKIVEESLSTEYFEFKISYPKYKVFDYLELSKNRLFEKYLNKLASTYAKSIKKQKYEKRNIIDINSVQVEYFFNLLIEDIVSDNISNDIKETYAKVALRRIFHYPINMVKLYQYCNKNSEIKENVENLKIKLLFLINRFPQLIYELHYSNIFNVVNITLVEDELSNLYDCLVDHTKSTNSEKEILYWFFKLIVLKNQKDYSFENINLDNKLLIVFLIKHKSMLKPELCIQLEEIVNTPKNAINENWLLFYEYLFYKKKSPFDINTHFIDLDKQIDGWSKDVYFNWGRHKTGWKSVLQSMKSMIDNDYSFVKDEFMTNQKTRKNALAEISKKWYIKSNSRNDAYSDIDAPF